MDHIITYLKYGNRFVSIEHTQQHGKDIIHGLVLKKKKNELYIEKSFSENTITELKRIISKNKSVNLVINTNAVLTKMARTKSTDLLKLAHLSFPNIKINDFYVEILNQGDIHFVSICRKSYIENLIKDYSSNGITIVDFSLGNLIASELTPFIEFESFFSSNAELHIESNKITEITTLDADKEYEYNINGLSIISTQLLSFAAVLRKLSKNKTTITSFSNRSSELLSSFNQKLFATQFLKIGLSILFILLLINFLFFNHYYNELSALKGTSQILETSKEKMLSLNQSVQQKEKMVSDILKHSSSKSSYYINAIINQLPESILLTECNYQPVFKRIKDGKPIEYEKNTIIISGRISDRNYFSHWISQLENYDWVRSVNITVFEDLDKSTSKFTIRIDIHEKPKD
ncbi:hypothetical protein [Winogradskyella tangerina]|uniref:hypothetical protein n=1 Tax=Winogradskyella tangerina TaxID=2023240 RepID=UPI000DBE4204|nr:hypothetical protein [Winogradskyella tangerina]